MKNTIIFASFLLAILSGCAARTGVTQPRTPQPPRAGGLRLFPPQLTVVVLNNTTAVLALEQNGSPIYIGNRPLALLPGATASREIYSFFEASGDFVLTVKGYCYQVVSSSERDNPDATTYRGQDRSAESPVRKGQPVADCLQGQYLGTASRSISRSYSGGSARVELWQVESLQGPRGVWR